MNFDIQKNIFLINLRNIRVRNITEKLLNKQAKKGKQDKLISWNSILEK